MTFVDDESSDSVCFRQNMPAKVMNSQRFPVIALDAKYESICMSCIENNSVITNNLMQKEQW